MGDASAKRSMDDFILNPIVPMEDYSDYEQSSSQFDTHMPFDLSNSAFAKRYEKRLAGEATTIRRFDDKAAWWHGYASDEEVASPAERDDFTFDSASSNGDEESIASIHEAQFHSQTTDNAAQLCNRAQAVQLVSAGKAKVVSMPKLVDVTAPYSPYTSSECARGDETRPTGLGIYPTQSAAREYYVYSSSSNDRSSPQSLDEDSFSSTPVPRSNPTSGVKLVRRKPNLPRLQTSTRKESPESFGSTSTSRTAWPMGQPSFLEHDPFALESTQQRDSASPQTKRKLRRLSPPFSLKSITRSLRRGGTPDSSPEADLTERDNSDPIHSPTISDIHVPTRTSSRPMPKMVARGAAERAAAIEIPPCPDDYDDSDDLRFPEWPARNDPAAYYESSRPLATRTHGRRKSLSAFVSTHV